MPVWLHRLRYKCLNVSFLFEKQGCVQTFLETKIQLTKNTTKQVLKKYSVLVEVHHQSKLSS